MLCNETLSHLRFQLNVSLPSSIQVEQACALILMIFKTWFQMVFDFDLSFMGYSTMVYHPCFKSN